MKLKRSGTSLSLSENEMDSDVEVDLTLNFTQRARQFKTPPSNIRSIPSALAHKHSSATKTVKHVRLEFADDDNETTPTNQIAAQHKKHHDNDTPKRDIKLNQTNLQMLENVIEENHKLQMLEEQQERLTMGQTQEPKEAAIKNYNSKKNKDDKNNGGDGSDNTKLCDSNTDNNMEACTDNKIILNQNNLINNLSFNDVQLEKDKESSESIKAA